MAGKTSEEIIYDSVAALSLEMDESRLQTTLAFLSDAVRGFEVEALRLPEVRSYLYILYNDKIRTGHSITHLSRERNQSKRGWATKLSRRIESDMKYAANRDIQKNPEAAVLYLLQLKINYDILLGNDLLDVIRSSRLGSSAMAYYGDIETIREQLFKATIKLASKVAKEQAAPLSGDVVQYEDLFQQSVIELRRAIAKYVPTDTENPVRAFISYVTNTTRYNVSHYVIEQSRTVSVPRTVIDRYRPVLQAMEEGYIDYSDLAKRASQILYERRDRKLTEKEVYTIREVYDLISVTQESDSLDAEVATDERGQPATLADRIEDLTASPERELDGRDAGKKLMEVLRHYCDPTEYAVMELRWGMGKVRGLKETADIYREASQEPMNKTRVAHIERDLINRLRTGLKNGDTRLLQIKAVLEEL